jgi:signal transduction histidine kinase
LIWKTNIDIELIYRIDDELPYDMKFDILSVVREAITNCVKHSNATELKIILLNQPKFYSIIIKDNGSKFSNTDDFLSNGIGLLSMNEIASKYNGFLNYEFNKGFKIHLTLMKG